MCIRDSFPLGGSTKAQVREEAAERGFAVARKLDSHDICFCLLYTSDAADERSSVDLGGRRIIKKKNNKISVGKTINAMADRSTW